MKKDNYPYYDSPLINTLRELIFENGGNDNAEQTAFTFRRKKEIVKKSYGQFIAEVRGLGEYILNNITAMHIGIYGENSYEWLLFYFAVVSSGRVAVPIDVGLSAKDSLDLIDRSKCGAVVYSCNYRDVSECWREQGLNITLIDMGGANEYISYTSNEMEIEHSVLKFDSITISENALATIVYTSGTTGKSKGVMLTHKNICADIVHSCESFIIHGGVVAFLPFHHIFGMVVGIMMVYHYGYPIHINHSLKYIMRDLKQFKPQTLMLVPLYVETFYKNIFDEVKKQGKEKKVKRAMKLAGVLLRFGIDIRKKLFREITDSFGGKLDNIICGGATLDPYYVGMFHRLGIEVYNGYGITECASVISVNRNRTNVTGSVGQVIPGCEVRIADDGEILARGDNVFSGYYLDEKSTKEGIIDGWYHTGDMGYIECGSLYINGRKKNLIILSNGENISPELIEQELSQMASICEVIVRGEDNRLVAEVFPSENVIDGDYETVISGDIENWNRNQPMYRRIGDIRYRMTEFEKTTSKKIKR